MIKKIALQDREIFSRTKKENIYVNGMLFSFSNILFTLQIFFLQLKTTS